MDHKQEKLLIRQLQSGDSRGFAPLVDCYKKPIINLAYRLTGSLEDSEDLAQETFVRAYKSIALFDAEKKFFPWLYTICLNLCRNFLKNKKYQPVEDLSENSASSRALVIDPESCASRQEENCRIQSCLLQLPIKQREALVLRFFQGMSFGEIVEITGESLSSAKMRVYRGLDALRELVDSEGDGG